MATRWPAPAIALVLILEGCASPAKMAGMVVGQSNRKPLTDNSFANAIYVEHVTGGQTTNPLWTSEVDTPEFRGALEESLDNYGMLNSDRENSLYILNVDLLGMDQDALGMKMASTAYVNYALREKLSGEPYFAETITSSHTTSVGDAFVGVKRLRLANEGAIRSNIQIFLDRLLGVDLSNK